MDPRLKAYIGFTFAATPIIHCLTALAYKSKDSCASEETRLDVKLIGYDGWVRWMGSTCQFIRSIQKMAL